jgi:diguanylate cyclase (GGDEF)-like protein/PAS domain S-box-containing protein
MTRFALRIFVLALVIFTGGWLGMQLVVPPGYASPLWPPAGMAIGCLLIMGRQFWPGVFLGAVGSQFYAAIQFSGHLDINGISSAVLIAGGSTLQAVLAIHLCSKWVARGVPTLDAPKQILLFSALTGPVSSLTSASIGVVSLVGLDMLPSSEAWLSWFNWWIGDTLGALLITPLILCLGAKPKKLWQPRRFSVAIPLLLTLIVISVIFTGVYNSEKIRTQMEFDGNAASINRLLVDSTHHIIDNTLSLADLFNASSKVDRNTFAKFTQSMQIRHPEIQALEWLPKVKADDLESFEQLVQAEGFSDFKVTERNPLGKLQPVTPREYYFPILYVEPLVDNKVVLGLDSASQPQSWQSKQIAIASGKPSASQLIKLIQRPIEKSGLLVSVPLFPSDNISLRIEDLKGFVTLVIQPTRLMEQALQGLDIVGLGINLVDIDTAQTVELFARPLLHPTNPNYGLKPWRAEFWFCDRLWQLTITADKEFLVEHGSTMTWTTLIGGLFFTSLMSILLLIISGRTAQVEALVDARTLDLQNANLELQSTERTLRESESRIRTLVESQPECVKLLRRDNTLLEMNSAGLAMIGADSFEQVKNINVSLLLLPDYRQAFVDLHRRVFAGESGTLEFEIQNLKGEHRWLATHAVPLRNDNKRIVAALGITRDITEHKHNEASLKLAARVFGEAHEGILITDASGNIIDVNPMFCEITGYSRDEMLGENPRILQSGRHSDEFYSDMWQSLLQTKHWQGEVWNRKKDGELYAELLSLSALCNEQGDILYYVGLFSDITESKKQQQLLELMAHYDPLTRLPNRTLFADRLLQAIAHSRRDKSLLAICFLDLDGFKPVNDQFGHDAGDQVLIEVAERIKNCVREEDSVSRHGGDEFALLMGNLHSIEECQQAIHRIHQAITEPYFIKGQAVTIGVSSGITIFPLDDADSDTLLRHADHAMYQAKLAGKNRYQLFDSSQDQQVIDKNKHLRELQEAFDAKQFCLYYQPKIDLRSGEVTGVEALIRWIHPERGIIPPLAFLPTIASTELEIHIGNWVIQQAWQQLIAWHRQGLMLEVSVNVSAYHLLWPKFSSHLESILAEAPQIASRYLQLEILESTALDDLSAVNRVVKACRDAIGISIALDDFGTGYSSLAHLRHLPVDTVKIDKSFVRDMLDDPDDYAIVESVISLGHAFRREVIAEGVEALEQGTILLLLGCHLAQGYIIAKPMPGDQIADWVANYRPHTDWLEYAENNMNNEQTLIAIRRIDLQQWLQRVEACLNSPISNKTCWPIMNPNNSHFGQWLRKANYLHKYDPQRLETIANLHKEMLHLGSVLMHHYLDGDSDDAGNGLEQLRQLQQRMDTQLLELLDDPQKNA